MSNLPVCRVQNPTCGACGGETEWDDDGLACFDCGLDYGDGSDYTEATFLDEDAKSCAVLCTNYWHEPHRIVRGKGYECRPCALPEGHKSDHWSECELIDITEEA